MLFHDVFIDLPLGSAVIISQTVAPHFYPAASKRINIMCFWPFWQAQVFTLFLEAARGRGGWEKKGDQGEPARCVFSRVLNALQTAAHMHLAALSKRVAAERSVHATSVSRAAEPSANYRVVFLTCP